MRRCDIAFTAVLFLVFLPAARLRADQAPQDKKALETKAKAIAKEAKQLEQRKDFKAARERYVDAQAIATTNDATNGILRVDEELRKQTRKLLDQAEKEFKAGHPEPALKILADAEKLLPNEPAVHYNTAVVLANMHRESEAIDRLDRAASLSTNDERQKTLEFKSSLTTRRTQSIADVTVKDKIKDLNAAMEDSANFERVCHELSELRSALPNEPNILLNLARCAEHDGRFDEAVQLFDAYAKAAPSAVDAGDVQKSSKRIGELDALQGPAGERVRAEYSRAAQLLRKGLFAETLDAYANADSALPEYPETQWRLASLHQALGNTEKAKAYYQRYLTLEKEPNRLETARAEMEAMTSRQAKYDERAAEGEKRLLQLLTSVFVSGDPINPDYGRRQLAEITNPLQDALALVPLALNANAASAVAYIIGNNYEPAKHSYLAVRDKNVPAIFYAEFLVKARATDMRLLGKCEITTEETLVVIPIAKFDKKSKRWIAEKSSGDVLLSYAARFNGTREGETPTVVIKRAAVRSVETEDDHVKLVYDMGELIIKPKYLTSAVPEYGPPARRAANPYAKLIRDFLPYKDAKLGKESLTGGEKFGMVMSAVAAAYASYSMMSMYGLTTTAQQINAIAMAMRDASEALQQGVLRQRELLQVSQFRLIPTETYDPKFRAELF